MNNIISFNSQKHEVHNKSATMLKEESNENTEKDILWFLIKNVICIILLDLIIVLPRRSFYLYY